MKKGASVTNRVNKLNSTLSRLLLVDMKLDDEVQILLLLAPLPEKS